MIRNRFVPIALTLLAGLLVSCSHNDYSQEVEQMLNVNPPKATAWMDFHIALRELPVDSEKRAQLQNLHEEFIADLAVLQAQEQRYTRALSLALLEVPYDRLKVRWIMKKIAGINREETKRRLGAMLAMKNVLRHGSSTDKIADVAAARATSELIRNLVR